MTGVGRGLADCGPEQTTQQPNQNSTTMSFYLIDRVVGCTTYAMRDLPLEERAQFVARFMTYSVTLCDDGGDLDWHPVCDWATVMAEWVRELMTPIFNKDSPLGLDVLEAMLEELTGDDLDKLLSNHIGSDLCDDDVRDWLLAAQPKKPE
jgi:hypothetical protein